MKILNDSRIPEGVVRPTFYVVKEGKLCIATSLEDAKTIAVPAQNQWVQNISLKTSEDEAVISNSLRLLVEEGIVGSDRILDGNHRFRAMLELEKENYGWGDESQSG